MIRSTLPVRRRWRGGNYGIPLCELVLDASDAVWAVVEVSSFQMELSGNLAPDVAVLLNLQADHLDRHGTMEVYRSLKERLFAGQGLGQMAILPQGYREKYGWGLHRHRRSLLGQRVSGVTKKGLLWLLTAAKCGWPGHGLITIF